MGDAIRYTLGQSVIIRWDSTVVESIPTLAIFIVWSKYFNENRIDYVTSPSSVDYIRCVTSRDKHFCKR